MEMLKRFESSDMIEGAGLEDLSLEARLADLDIGMVAALCVHIEEWCFIQGRRVMPPPSPELYKTISVFLHWLGLVLSAWFLYLLSADKMSPK